VFTWIVVGPGIDIFKILFFLNGYKLGKGGGWSNSRWTMESVGVEFESIRLTAGGTHCTLSSVCWIQFTPSHLIILILSSHLSLLLWWLLPPGPHEVIRFSCGRRECSVWTDAGRHCIWTAELLLSTQSQGSGCWLFSTTCPLIDLKQSGGGGLLMEVAITSETSVNFYHTTRRDTPEDSHLQNLLLSIRFPCTPWVLHRTVSKVFLYVGDSVQSVSWAREQYFYIIRNWKIFP
jgi:hypothetical protein